jgi:hypothetical protein
MSPWETLGVFAGIPAAIVALIVIGVYGKSMMHQPNRYRPGRPWDFEPAWYVPHPDAIVHGSPDQSGQPTTAVGGASGEW